MLRKTCQQTLEQGAQAPERAGEEGEVADRELPLQRAPDDIGVGDVVADRPDRGE